MTFTKDDLKRVFWTGVQAFLATALTLGSGFLSAPNLATAKAILIASVVAAAAAAFSALKNLVLQDGTWAK